MARVSASITPAERDSTRVLVTMAIVVAALYYGSEIFIPIALAVLLSFLLAPAVRKLHAWGLGRVFPVLVVTMLAFSIIFGLLGVMGSQLRDLAGELPRYEGTITRKIATLRNATSNGVMDHVEQVLAKLNRAVTRAGTAVPSAPQNEVAPSPAQAGDQSLAQGNAQRPVPVEIRQPAPSSMDTLMAVVSPLLHPLAMSGIVVIFVVFMLLQREDLRNRLIRLFGSSDLQRTTAAINDGARRLSRYFMTQSAINALSGLVVGAAAWTIGIPNPLLWGILFAIMRFVPYIGAVIGGVLPVAFAAAVDQGWSMALWMAGIVVVVEFTVGQVLEPLLYGHNTGLSPVAVVVAATFWTVLWGPIGLLLSTPLTVCLVVIGRHVEQLAFLDVLLGDRPPLTPAETFYQRMLANDPTEVSEQADVCLRTMTLLQYFDTVMLPGLLLAQSDATAERLSVDRQIQIRDATNDVIEDLSDEQSDDSDQKASLWDRLRHDGDETSQAPSAVDVVAPPPSWQRDRAILCIGARGPLDDSAAAMLAAILERRGLGVQAESYAMLSKANIFRLDAKATRLVCLSCFDGSSSAYLRFALRRVRRQAPRAKILIGAWWMQASDSTAPNVQMEDNRPLSEPSATTIVDAVRFCLAAASSLNEDELTPVAEPEDKDVSVP